MTSRRISFEIIKKVFLPVLILVLFFSGYIFYRTNIIPTISEELAQSLKKYIVTILIVCIAFIIQRVIGAILVWYRDNIATKTVTRLDDELIPLVRRVLKVLVWVIAFLIILPFYGINISALITTLGISSLAVALAAQDTIANIIAGFMIMVDKPFRLKDKIKLPSGEVVEVLDIGVRRSKFLSEDKAIIVVPNLDLSKSKIINYTYGEERLAKL
jgi:small-conductance mechanosensitive channel